MNRPTRLRASSLGLRHIFRWPLLIGLLNVAGLVSALVGDGWYDALSWLLLGGTLILMIVLLAKRSSD